MNKRKHEESRQFPIWQLIAAFALGMIAMLLVVQLRTTPSVTSSGAVPAEMMMTATYVVEQATVQAEQVALDGIAQTVTHIIEQATATAQASGG